MPSCSSSQAVSREPCSSGRVSSTSTSIRLPGRCAVLITPSALPMPPVASEPALQCVSTVEPSSISAAPSSPMRRSSAICCCVDAPRLALRSPASTRAIAARARASRSIAQRRFTAVGRVAASSARGGVEVRRDVARRQRKRIRRRDADQRRAAQREPPDRARDLAIVARLDVAPRPAGRRVWSRKRTTPSRHSIGSMR